ncbi:MAG: winged helix DNA-binding protein [Oscillospiraceae bacterium]|nr:winged helix DNA-binding protein [Oscillospiraceae bacterium]
MRKIDANIFITHLWAIFFNTKNNIHRIIEPILHTENITTPQTFILFAVKQHYIKNISGVCREMNINQGNASTMCKKMEQAGLIKRERSTEDERIVTLSITEKGDEILNRLKQKMDMFNEYCNELPEEHMKTVIKGLNQFEEILKNFIFYCEGIK